MTRKYNMLTDEEQAALRAEMKEASELMLKAFALKSNQESNQNLSKQKLNDGKSHERSVEMVREIETSKRS